MPPFARLVVPDAVLADVVQHARRDAPVECCGLLAGHIAACEGRVTARFPIANVLRSPTDYLTEPHEMLRAFRAMRAAGLELLAIYHSHPTSAPVPSARDIAGNSYGESVPHVIVSLAGEAAAVRAWWLTDTGCREAGAIEAVGRITG
ncbi:MAG: M67 family metallopeptidase [Gemmata sp.]|jgi:proteasome lid subunit RPN8/RPN11